MGRLRVRHRRAAWKSFCCFQRSSARSQAAIACKSVVFPVLFGPARTMWLGKSNVDVLEPLEVSKR